MNRIAHFMHFNFLLVFPFRMDIFITSVWQSLCLILLRECFILISLKTFFPARGADYIRAGARILNICTDLGMPDSFWILRNIYIFLVCRNLKMNSFYLSCFLMALLLAACTASPVIDLDEDNYDSELSDEVSQLRQSTK